VFANVVIVLPFLLIQIYNAFFDYANFFKDIFNLFSKVLIINEKKKQQLTRVWQNGCSVILSIICF